MNSLKERVVLITGASRGIGAETARLFAGEGARLILCARNEEKLREVADEVGARAVRCDVSAEKSVEELFSVVWEEFGRLDVVVNNAGIFRCMPFTDTSPEVFDEVVSVNLRGVFLVSRKAFELMSCGEGGIIINISSTAGKQAFDGSSAYCASKFGVVGLSRVLALEGRELGIRVTVIYPGAVDTDIWDGISDERRGFLKPEEVAKTILFATQADVGELDIRPF